MRVRRKRPAWTKESETYAQRNREKTIIGGDKLQSEVRTPQHKRRCAISLPKILTSPLRLPCDIAQNQALTGMASRLGLN